MKTGRKGLDYLKLILLTEQRICDLQIEEANEALTIDVGKEGAFSLDHFYWHLDLQDTSYEGINKGILTVSYNNNRSASLDTVIYLKVTEEVEE